jgi:hypothetical protein
MSGYMSPVNAVVGGTVLRRAAIESPNYVAGSAGWIIKQDGSAEFNNVTIRGGTVEDGTAFYYSGTPAAGNMIASVAAANGTDSHGNHYLAGITSYSVGTPFSFAVNLNNGQVQYFTAAANSAGPWTNQTVGLTIAEVAAGVWAPQLVTASNLLEMGGSPIGVTSPWAGLDSAGTGPETFQSFTFANSWAQASGRLTCGYEMNALGDMFIEGSVTVPAGFAANQAITSATPAYYQPSHTQSLIGWDLTGNLPVRLAYTSGGVLQFSGPVANTASGHNLDIPKQTIDLIN